jgi:hypothetical protein
VGIFRRGKNAGSADPADQLDAVATDSDDVDAENASELTDSELTDSELTDSQRAAGSADETGQSTARAMPASGTNATSPEAAGRVGDQGPFDAADVDIEDDGRLDLGALRIKGMPGMELRLEIDEGAGQVVGATAVIGDSAVQIQAFAAPRTMGIWDDIRGEIAESILAQGGTADEVRGPLGTELRTRMPSAGPDGRTVFAPARFAGVDGPRWFLRAVFSGRAAIEDEAARSLLDVVRSTVVVRGDTAMAPREMLVLRLPEQVEVPETDGSDDSADDADGADARQSAGHVDDLKPFERGPEITEVR